MNKIVLRTVDGITYKGKFDYLKDGIFFVREVITLQGDSIIMPDFEENSRFKGSVKFKEDNVVWYYTDSEY